ncbi:SCP2 sterol-binding domain-containing protein [Marinospirillum alkaliphilum]|uniref:SCP-2 sterol transfer family protein n=1 Tax=Marinospirillum alkaliphilum DSM 21637 TaxID=1122209 RepID=A0A1K1WKR7_9GAMM|nr:SCP2 sterol-binding domain-containing protein [Marinospirillum alkaliphilum]SFX37977.1 SCP-2 sterol transfer family protein [Marinospirillum alkaliphilum DSM 21637]
MLKLRFLLWMLGRLLKGAWRKDEAFRQKLEQQPLRFVIKTSDQRLGRSYSLQPNGIQSTSGDLDQADMKLVFNTPTEAWQTLTSKDKNAFMRAIQEGAVKVEGDYKQLFHLQGLMKHLKV